MKNNTVSERILELMQKHDLSYGKLAEITGVPKSALQRYATGETRKLSFDRLKIIADALGCTSAYLLGWEEEIKKDPVALAEKHIEILMDEEFVGLFYKYKALDAKQRKVVRNLIDSLSDTND